MEYLYYRDNTQITEEEWWQHLNEDIDVVQTKHDMYEIKSAVCADIDNGNETIVNQHRYTRKTIENSSHIACPIN